MPGRCVLIVLDGLGDRSYASLDHMTPLQSASTTNLDALAEMGANGLYHADRLGVALSSQDAHFALYGYDRAETLRRGILEAVGSGLEVGTNDVAVLGRLITAERDNGILRIVDRRPPADPDRISGLMSCIDRYETNGIGFRFTQINQLEGILILTGNVSPHITDTDPLCNGLPAPSVKPFSPHESDPAAQATARALTEYLIWVHRTLSEHPLNRAGTARGEMPLNAMITHLADGLRPIEPFRERWGLAALSISPKLVQWGVSRSLGMDTARVKDSRDPGKDIADRITLAVHKLPQYEFIHVHSMAPDQAAHTKNPLTKRSVIEALDAGIGRAIGPLLSNPDVLLAVTADHSTPSGGPLIHSGEPVPMVFVGQGVRRDAVRALDEIQCASGALGTVRGREFMLMVLNYLDRCKLRGIMQSPRDRDFWPGDYEPFRIED
ncbi:MAG: alkaline phosphatase family protein [Desulfomonilaceae bacterium]|nr:alkaline phosphatase family protein [Desulfomonilaceae bacterium]